LEQEKYHLRRRLQAAEEEYDLRVNYLQADIVSLKKSLDEATVVQRQSDREKSLLITNLSEQNQRLTTQLKEVSNFNAYTGWSGASEVITAKTTSIWWYSRTLHARISSADFL
jgi:hypothetical protein